MYRHLAYNAYPAQVDVLPRVSLAVLMTRFR